MTMSKGLKGQPQMLSETPVRVTEIAIQGGAKKNSSPKNLRTLF
jgi:hypothetical protein